MSRGRKRSRAAETRRRARRALASGNWPEWDKITIDPPSGRGWFSEMKRACRNGVFAVLIREVKTPWGEVTHLAIRTLENTDFTWADRQRIKNEIAGTERTAVEVFPAESELVDEANMYHLWVLPKGFTLPFTI